MPQVSCTQVQLANRSFEAPAGAGPLRLKDLAHLEGRSSNYLQYFNIVKAVCSPRMLKPYHMRWPA